MFLNLPSRNKRLSLDFGLPRSKSYLSTLNNNLLNKEKSYSTASLKQELKQFKNKSLSYGHNITSSNNNYGSQNIPSLLVRQQIKGRLHSPAKRNTHTVTNNSYINSIPITSTSSGMKLNDFKKTYLNLDSKLSKTAKKQKDYFRSIQQSQNAKNYEKINNNYQQIPAFKKQPSAPSFFIPSTYLQVQKRLQKEDSRRKSLELNLREEMIELRELNDLLKRQNQELKKQRIIDLDLIARQNEIMQKQQELIEANQEAAYITQKKLTDRIEETLYNESNAFTFSNGKETKMFLGACEECRRKGQQPQVLYREAQVQNQFMLLKMEKMEEEKSLLKAQIHELVYQCESHKETIRKTEEKYQKQLQHNQKLLKIIENMLENNQPEKLIKHQPQYQYEQIKNSSLLNRQPYLNLSSSNQIQQQNEPVSIKKDKESKYQSEINSPMQRLYEKSSNFKSVSNLIKYNVRQQNLSNERGLKKESSNQDSKFKNYFMESQKHKEIQKEKEKSLDWCQNENIRKYLDEINKQKIREIDQIESLLQNQ